MTVQTCSKCKEDLSIENFHYRKDTQMHYKHCKECHRKMVNKNYQDNSEEYLKKKKEYHSKNVKVLTESAIRYYKKNPEKREAHVIFRKAILNGEVKPKTNCELCNSAGKGNKSKIHAHHTDYSKPLSVIWLCAKCHKGVHLGRIKL